MVVFGRCESSRLGFEGAGEGVSLDLVRVSLVLLVFESRVRAL